MRHVKRKHERDEDVLVKDPDPAWDFSAREDGHPRSPSLMLRGNIAGLLRARHLDLYLLKKSLLPL